MNFNDFLTENKTAFQKITSDQFGILRKELSRSKLRITLDEEYIEKSDLDISLFNNDFYLSGVALGKNGSDTLIQGSVIIEVNEEDGYVYYKIATFVYNIDTDELQSITENDRVRDENWKIVQVEILKTSTKL